MTSKRRKAWNCPHGVGGLRLMPSGPPRVHFVPNLMDVSVDDGMEFVPHSWQVRDEPNYHERKKKGYETLREAFARKELETP